MNLIRRIRWTYRVTRLDYRIRAAYRRKDMDAVAELSMESFIAYLRIGYNIGEALDLIDLKRTFWTT